MKFPEMKQTFIMITATVPQDLYIEFTDYMKKDGKGNISAKIRELILKDVEEKRRENEKI
jgi:metal-responsive CopG/Arc/MetJ family transcriptional regulator